MPHLTFCGRYYRISADELPMPLFCVIIGRVAWTALLSVALIASLQGGTKKCTYGWYGLPVYLGFSVLAFVLNILNSVCISWIGNKGLIFETEKREAMSRHLVLQVAVMVLEAACAVFGMIVFVDHYSMSCFADTTTKELVLIAVVVLSQFVDLALFMCLYCTVRSRRVNETDTSTESKIGSGSDPESSHEKEDPTVIWFERVQMLINRIKCCCCNILGGDQVLQDDLESVAKVFAKFFHHDGFLDIVPGDALAGLILVHMVQKKAKEQHDNSNPVYDTSAENIDVSNASTGAPEMIRSTSSRILMQELAEDSATDTDGQPSPRIRRGNLVLIGDDVMYGNTRSRVAMQALANRRELRADDAGDCRLVENISELMPYCLAVYSAVFVAIIYPCSFLCRLGASCLVNWGSHDGLIFGDHYGCHKAGTLHHLRGVSEQKSELVYGNFANNVLLSPYCIFADHEKRRVVVAIRGTLSVEDAITDTMAETVEMTAMGQKWGFDGRDRFAHEGFLKSADYIRSELDKNGVLERLFAPKNVSTSSMGGGGNHDDEITKYELTITGHSLGAGLATLVSYLLRPKYPALTCVAFAPPAVVLDQATSVECKGWMTSVVLGDDCISRLNFFSLGHMRERVLDALVRSKVNKMKIFTTSFKNFDENDFLYAPGEEPESFMKKSIEAFKDKIHQHHKSDVTPQCTIGGRIIHFAEVGTKPQCLKCRKAPPRFRPFEVSWESMLEITISKKALVHHFPDKYVEELNYARETFGID